MSDAIATPTRRSRREMSSTDVQPPQEPDIILPDDHLPELSNEGIAVAEKAVLDKAYQDQIAFAEEPVTIILQDTGEENAPEFQECWVNGRGIEFMMDNGKFRVNYPGVPEGYAPIGVEFTTKRKYVEVLARKRVTKIRTVHDDTSVERPVNRVTRHTTHVAPLSVIGDRSPKGAEWLSRLLRS